MHHIKHKYFFTVTAFLVCLTLLSTGCGRRSDQSNPDESNSSKGRYLEEEYTLPGSSNIEHLVQKKDGTLAALSDNLSLYLSGDSGKTWTKQNNAILDELSETVSVCSMAFKDDDTLLLYYMDYSSEMPEENIMEISPDGTRKDIKLSLPDNLLSDSLSADNNTDVYREFSFSEKTLSESESEAENKITDSEADESDNFGLSYDFNSDNMEMIPIDLGDISPWTSVYEITYTDTGDYLIKGYGFFAIFDKETKEIKCQATDKSLNSASYIQLGQQLIVSDGTSYLVYDTETGEQKENLTFLEEQLSSGSVDSTANMIMSGNSGQKLSLAKEDDTTLYILNRSGIYRYTLGGSVIEQLVDGNLTSLASSSLSFTGFFTGSSKDFLVNTINDSENSILYHYYYSADAEAFPSQELKVYSLYDNDLVRQAVIAYQKEHTNIKVSFEAGINGDDAVTVSDALRTLNTEILAGNGPDLLVLDGMPLDSFMEKGLLDDLSGITDKIREDESAYFTNIWNGMKQDGKTLAIPMRFSIPIMIGNPDILSSIKDADSLANEFIQAKSGTPLFCSANKMVSLLYPGIAGQLINEDHSLNEEVLTCFLSDLTKLAALGESSDDSNVNYSVISSDADDETSGLDTLSTDMFYENIPMAFGPIDSLSLYTQLKAIQKTMKDTAICPMAGLEDYAFTPSTIMGISTKSKQKDLAADFLLCMLSDEVQSSSQYGLPISRTALDKSIAGQTPTQIAMVMFDEENGIMKDKSLTIDPLTAEEKDDFYRLLQSLKTPLAADTTIINAIADGFSDCMENKTSAEKAARQIISSINIYLSE